MDDQHIEQELQKFNLTNAAISELNESYKDLTITSLDDKTGYAQVKNARMFVKNLRVDIDKRRKELTADALKFQRAINNEAKRIIDLIQPLEDRLQSKEKWYELEHANIKAEAAIKLEKKIMGRVTKLLATEAGYDGVAFTWLFLDMPLMMDSVRNLSDQDFDELLAKITCDFLAFDERRKQAANEARELREKQEAEFKQQQEMLAAERKALDDKAAALEAEAQRIKNLEKPAPAPVAELAPTPEPQPVYVTEPDSTPVHRCPPLVDDEMITITKRQYDELLDSDKLLNILIKCGVNDWGGFDEAERIFFESE